MILNSRLFKRTILATSVALISGQTMAAGFQLNAQSATGLGRAFAGDAVIADNASVMSRNAAAMSLFKKTELSLGFETISTKIKAKDVDYKFLDASFSTSTVDNESYSGAGSTSVAPNLHLIVPINDKFAFGVDLYSNFGTKTDYSESLAWSQYGGLTDVKSVNLGLAGSYRINEQWSIGAGLDIIYGEGKLKREMGYNNGVIPKGTTLASADADGFAVGYNLGTVCIFRS